MRLIDSMQSEMRKSHSTNESFLYLIIHQESCKGKSTFFFWRSLPLSRVCNLGFYSNLDGFWNLKEREREMPFHRRHLCVSLSFLCRKTTQKSSPTNTKNGGKRRERETFVESSDFNNNNNNKNGETDDDCARFGRSSVSRRIGHRRDARFRILQTTGENAVQKAELGGGTAVENVVRIRRVLHALRDRKWSVLLDAVR